MAVPSRAELRVPVLRVLSSRPSMHTDSVWHEVGRGLELSPEDLAQTIGGGEALLRHRVWHCLDGLRKDGLVTKPDDGWWAITQVGRELLEQTR